MNALSIAAISGGASHLIPLFVLHQRYFRRIPELRNCFLLPKAKHGLFAQAGIDVLPIDYRLDIQSLNDNLQAHLNRLMELEQLAYLKAAPDLILEDNAFSTPLIAERNDIPRISIHRTGFFRSLPPERRNPAHMHSLEKGFEQKKYFDASYLLGATPDDPRPEMHASAALLGNYLRAKTKLIPGIPSIEVLPESIADKNSYFYTGPLIVEDQPSPKLIRELEGFLAKNQSRRKVFITMGLIDRSDIGLYVKHLLARGYAVIATSKTKVPQAYRGSYFFNPFLPLHFVCSQVDLVIHQCGSGMYHYPILNHKPAITLSTQCYDREDVAVRLQDLQVSGHVPHPNDNAGFLERFVQLIDHFENGKLCNFDQLQRLRAEIYQTMLDFDAEKMINYTLNRQSQPAMGA